MYLRILVKGADIRNTENSDKWCGEGETRYSGFCYFGSVAVHKRCKRLESYNGKKNRTAMRTCVAYVLFL